MSNRLALRLVESLPRVLAMLEGFDDLDLENGAGDAMGRGGTAHGAGRAHADA